MSADKLRPRMDMLVSTIGRHGIERLAASRLPQMDGLNWIVVWQCPQGSLPVSLVRDDVRVVESWQKGLCRSRNMALGLAEADVAVICDDDIDYTPSGLQRLMDALSRRSEALMAFRVEVPGSGIVYPAQTHSLERLPRGYWLRSCEMALRPALLRDKGIAFNENFGLGSPMFQSGEEDILRIDILEAGLGAVFIPVEAGSHRGAATTGMRRDHNHWLAKGAVTMRLHPATWPLRLMKYGCRAWVQGCGGAIEARRRNVFISACGGAAKSVGRETEQ